MHKTITTTVRTRKHNRAVIGGVAVRHRLVTLAAIRSGAS